MNICRQFCTTATLFFVTLLVVSSLNAEDLKPEITTALANADTAKAITALDSQIAIDPSFHLNYYTLGTISFARGNWSEAQAYFEIALDKKSKHYESLYLLGLCQLNQGDFEAASKTMERGIAKAKKLKAKFQNGYGLVLLAQEKYDESLSYLLQAVNADDKNAEYHINVGDAYYYMGVPYTAVDEYAKALELDTAGTEVYFHWAEACLEMKDFTCALEKLRIVMRKDSTYIPAWSRAGEIYFKAAMSARTRQDKNARFRESIGAYQKYLSLAKVTPDSNSVRVFFEIGMAYAAINGFEAAAEEFEKVLAIPFVPKDIYFNYGKALTRIKRYEDGAANLKKHLDWVAAQDERYTTRIREWEIYQLLGDCYFYSKTNKNFHLAVTYYKKSIEIRPEQKRLIQNIAIGLDRLKQYKEALVYYDQRIEMGIDSASSGYLRNAAYCALNLADTDDEEDLDEMDEMEEEEGDDVGGEVAVEEVYVDYTVMAADYLTKYLEFKPNDKKVIVLMATTFYHGLSDCENGLKWYRRLLELEPDNCDAMKWVGFAYFGGLCTKSYTKALNHFLKADACINPGNTASDLDLILWIAQCYHLRAVENSKDTAASKSDYKHAYDWYNKVLKADATNAEAKKGVEQTAYEY